MRAPILLTALIATAAVALPGAAVAGDLIDDLESDVVFIDATQAYLEVESDDVLIVDVDEADDADTGDFSQLNGRLGTCLDDSRLDLASEVDVDCEDRVDE